MALRWRILGLLFLARIGLGFQFQTTGSVANDLMSDFGIDYLEVGTLIGVFMLPGLFLAIPAGFTGRYLSDRSLCSLGMLALALGGFASGTAEDVRLVGLGRALCGFDFLLSSLYFTKMTADWFSGKEIATAMSLLVISWPLGIAFGQIGHVWIAEIAGWRWTFLSASIYCAAAAAALFAGYRAPIGYSGQRKGAPSWLSRRELQLTLIAAMAWGLFNAGYIVYLSFGPLMLESDGAGPIEAASVISIGSWLMVLSGVACGQLADRTGRPDLILVVCILGAMASLALLTQSGGGLAASILFGLVGMAPSGVIMALAGEAMRPEKRAFGMGIFLSVYFLINAIAPPVAGWLYGVTQDSFAPLAFGILLFGSVILANACFRIAQRKTDGNLG